MSTTTGDTALDAFLWSKGVITDLGSLGGPISLTFTKPNERGEVAGYSNTSAPDPNGEDFCNGLGTFLICLPFVWEKGVMTALPTLGGTNGQALGINNRGQIVGEAETPNVDPCSPFALQVEAVVWRDHQIEQVLPPLGGTVAVANAINDNGDAVGLSGCITGNVYAVLWQHGTPINLGTLGGVAGNIPFAINNRGQVSGQSDLPGDTLHHGFLWQNGVMTDLGGLPGLPTTQADDINNQGQVVGVAQDANSDESSGVAFLWENGVLTDLNTLIPPNFPLFLAEALSINDRGQIAGYGRLSNGDHRAFLLTPCNEAEEGCEDNAAVTGVAPVSPVTQRPTIGLPENLRQLLQSRSGFGRAWLEASRKSAATVTSTPIASLSPSSLSFPAQVLGTTSQAKTVTLKNTGNANLTITGINITGINPANFAQNHNCGSSLSAGASCAISVKFKPTAAGPRRAALSISDNAAGSPQKVTLSGIGVVSGPNATLSPTSLTFADQLVSTKSAGKSVKLTNYGTATLNITSITASGDFSQTHTCTSSLAPLAGCTINVTFKPAQIGIRTGTLSIADNAANTPQAVALSGTGVVSGPNATLSPTKLIFACRNAPGDGC
jgi:probable HAF family extracellular repeat protein